MIIGQRELHLEVTQQLSVKVERSSERSWSELRVQQGNATHSTFCRLNTHGLAREWTGTDPWTKRTRKDTMRTMHKHTVWTNCTLWTLIGQQQVALPVCFLADKIWFLCGVHVWAMFQQRSSCCACVLQQLLSNLLPRQRCWLSSRKCILKMHHVGESVFFGPAVGGFKENVSMGSKAHRNLPVDKMVAKLDNLLGTTLRSANCKSSSIAFD